MALLFSVPISSSSSLHGVSSTRVTLGFPSCRLPIGVLSKSFEGICSSTPVGKGLMTVKALSDSKGTGPDSWQPVSESDDEEEDVILDKLPLDSKLQLKLEHKMKMKLGKKIRLRRKKLGRKRRMRKRGQWPLSKVNKLKNV
ncbi:50S ribosomal protein [Salix suchowensis]|nr:50S ribosomal protein [Salix suchowensis]